jgi:general secretion pathway protein M
MEALLSWWNARAPRERLILAAGAAAVLVLVLLAVLLPLQRAAAEARGRVADKQAALAWLQTVEPQLSAAAATAAPAATGESLLVLAERAAREAGIAKALTGGQPSGNGAFRLRLEDVAFDSLAQWLAQLTQRHGVIIESATIDGREAPGAVSATFVLRLRC